MSFINKPPGSDDTSAINPAILRRKPAFGEAAVSALPELIFAILPLLVLTLVFIYLGKDVPSVLGSPEWSFGAAVLFGQAIVRFVSGMIRSGRADTEMVALFVSVLLVLGLVPSLAVLALVLHAHEGPSHLVPTWLVITQIVQFAGGIVVYLWFGGMGGLWLRGSDSANRTER